MDKIEQIARMCHQTNKAWCELNGDNSQKTGTTQQWQRDSAIKGVEFKLDNPDAGHDAQHNVADNRRLGVWRKKMRCLRHITV
jgi:hypothetical protein